MNNNFIDETGKTYGRLTVLQKTEKRNQKRAILWLCQCECGNQILVTGTNLRSGVTKSCGCLKKERQAAAMRSRAEDLTGKKFNMLTVLGIAEDYAKEHNLKSKRIYWKCKCDCGNITYVSSSDLKNGHTCSCGCYKSKRTKEIFMKDLTGQKFGKLTALSPTDKRKDGKIVWECQCDCGNLTYVSSSSLISGNTQSCGCLISKGEEKIKKLLKRNNIPYTPQKIFPTCRFPDSGAYAKFDFYINNSFLLEYDGIQHYSFKINDSGWNTKENYNITISHDNYKSQWCKENNIPLKRIPYSELKEITLDDIMSDKYLV